MLGAQQKKPGKAGLLEEYLLVSSFRELGDLVREPRDLSARIVLVNDVALRGLHQFRLRVRHRLQRRIAVAALDRLFDRCEPRRASGCGATC